MTDIHATLAERHARYGTFAGNAEIAQRIKLVMAETPNWAHLSADKRESLEFIASKIGRLLNGDPTYLDSWTDIAGYATLIAKSLET